MSQEIDWETVKANLDRLTDEALWDIVGIATRELRERKNPEQIALDLWRGEP